MSPEATKAALTALMYAYLRKVGAGVKIPDFSSSFGCRLTDADKQALEPLFETARQHAADEAYDSSVTIRVLRAKSTNNAIKRIYNPGDLVPVIFGRDHLPS